MAAGQAGPPSGDQTWCVKGIHGMSAALAAPQTPSSMCHTQYQVHVGTTEQACKHCLGGTQLLASTAYEARICQTGQVSTKLHTCRSTTNCNEPYYSTSRVYAVWASPT